MGKSDFIAAWGEKNDWTNKQATAAFDSFWELIATTIKKDKVQFPGIASFELKDKAAREGINPLTKQKIKIAASKNPVCKFGKTFKEQFNKKK